MQCDQPFLNPLGGGGGGRGRALNLKVSFMDYRKSLERFSKTLFLR